MSQPARRESMVGEINTLLGRGSEFEGKLTFEGTVRIDGTLRGEVFSDDVLIVGEGARLEAEVDIGEIIIQGTVVGNIRAKRSIEILTPGRVKGDLTTPNLQIDKGVIFEGRCFMEGVADKLAHGRKHAAEIVIEASPPPPILSGQIGGDQIGGGQGGKIGGGQAHGKVQGAAPPPKTPPVPAK